MGESNQKKCDTTLFFIILHESHLMFMDILQRKSVSVTFLCIKTDRNTLNSANVVDGTLLLKVRQRDVTGFFINIDGCNWSRDFLNQSKSMFQIFFVGSVDEFL